MKIKMFRGYIGAVERDVNRFIAENADKVILDFKQSAGDQYYIFVTIIYCDKFGQQNIEGKYGLK